MLAAVANTTDENTKTNVKKVMIGANLAGALIAKNQVDEFGFDKKQSDMAIGASLALAAVAARGRLRREEVSANAPTPHRGRGGEGRPRSSKKRRC